MENRQEWTEADAKTLHWFLKSGTGQKLVNNAYAQVLDAALTVGEEPCPLTANGFRQGMASMINAIVMSGNTEQGDVRSINPDIGSDFEAVDTDGD